MKTSLGVWSQAFGFGVDDSRNHDKSTRSAVNSFYYAILLHSNTRSCRYQNASFLFPFTHETDEAERGQPKQLKAFFFVLWFALTKNVLLQAFGA